MRLVEFHEYATRFVSLNDAALTLYHTGDGLKFAKSILIEQSSDGNPGYYIKLMGLRGEILGLIATHD